MKLFPSCIAVLAFCASLHVQAHTPYLAPASFDASEGGLVTLDASFSETFFVPEVAFDGSQFQVIGADGKASAPDKVVPLQSRVVVEHRLPRQPGTYRFSTGHRLGAVFRTWEVDGERRSSRDPAQKMPAGAKLVSDFQSLTRAETYITVGAPTQAALEPYGKGLELVPVTHPGDLYVGETFTFEVRYDGRPLADQKVEITEAVWGSDRKPEIVVLTTDASGRADFRMEHAGNWLALTRHRTKAPEGAAASEYSNSYTLTFRVLEQ